MPKLPAAAIPVIRALPRFPEVTAFFTTRQGGCSPAPFRSLNLGKGTADTEENTVRNWQMLAEAFRFDLHRLKMPRQAHSDTVCSADDLVPGDAPPRCDGIYSGTRNDVLAVTTADCLPVLLYDPKGPLIAAIHAGWKGSYLKILEKTLTTLLKRELIRRESAFLSFGPCIKPDRYEVRKDVASLFSSRHITEKGDKYLLDLPGANLAQALSCGIPRKNITICQECTYSQPERFFSYRRDGRFTGRMAAVIGLGE